MPMTPELRQQVDRIRDHLWAGGYPDPLSNAEQLSFLFFFYLLESIDAANARRAQRPGAPDYTSVFDGEWALKNPLNAPSKGDDTVPKDLLRWSSWARGRSGEDLVRWVRDEVFPFHAEIAEASATNFMDGARLSIDEPTVLTQSVSMVDALHLDDVDADTKGDLFEHVLRQARQAGELGQFRTPRHIIRAIVTMIDPKIGETVYDPAVGTAGFLIGAFNHIRLANSDAKNVETVELDGRPVPRGYGERLSGEAQSVLQNQTFYGNDVDGRMVRLATMNLTLRGLPNVRILRRNVLTTTLDRAERAEADLPLDGYNVVLANPPFSGKLDKDRIVDDVKVGTTTATEILFVRYMLNSLKKGGRCGVIVPEGLLFGNSGAHKELRRQLVENNKVLAVLSLPGGVFNPYAGVKTSVLFFEKGGATERVLFLQADNDGYKLDANHDQPIEDDDLPDLIAAYQNAEERWQDWQARKPDDAWTEKWWFAAVDDIQSNDFNLSAGRYRPMTQEQVEHRDPLELIDELKAIEREIMVELDELAEQLKEPAKLEAAE